MSVCTSQLVFCLFRFIARVLSIPFRAAKEDQIAEREAPLLKKAFCLGNSTRCMQIILPGAQLAGINHKLLEKMTTKYDNIFGTYGHS